MPERVRPVYHFYGDTLAFLSTKPRPVCGTQVVLSRQAWRKSHLTRGYGESVRTYLKPTKGSRSWELLSVRMHLFGPSSALCVTNSDASCKSFRPFQTCKSRHCCCCTARRPGLTALLSDSGPLPDQAAAQAQLALRHGGLGLRPAEAHAPAAFWASWADSVPAIRNRDPDLAQVTVDQLGGRARPVQILADLQAASAHLTGLGFEPPSWLALLGKDAPRPPDAEQDAPSLRPRPRCLICAGLAPTVTALIQHPLPCFALLLSQAGPCSAQVFTMLPTALEPSHFCVLLLRRLRLPLPLSVCPLFLWQFAGPLLGIISRRARVQVCRARVEGRWSLRMRECAGRPGRYLNMGDQGHSRRAAVVGWLPTAAMPENRGRKVASRGHAGPSRSTRLAAIHAQRPRSGTRHLPALRQPGLPTVEP